MLCADVMCQELRARGADVSVPTFLEAAKSADDRLVDLLGAVPAEPEALDHAQLARIAELERERDAALKGEADAVETAFADQVHHRRIVDAETKLAAATALIQEVWDNGDIPRKLGTRIKAHLSGAAPATKEVKGTGTVRLDGPTWPCGCPVVGRASGSHSCPKPTRTEAEPLPLWSGRGVCPHCRQPHERTAYCRHRAEAERRVLDVVRGFMANSPTWVQANLPTLYAAARGLK